MAKDRFFTLWLAGICIIMFILQKFISWFTDLFVLNNRAIHNLEFWRFVTAIFLHGSLTHILFNIFALLLFGLILEKIVGSWKFLIIFFFSGIIANLVSVNFYTSSLGSSGAIMGIIGCLTILNPLMMVWAFGLLMPMFIAAIIWILSDVLGIFMPSDVANISHLSGIGVGFLIGLLLSIITKKNVFRNNNSLRVDEDFIKDWEDRYVQ